jgi:hypothetical protein
LFVLLLFLQFTRTKAVFLAYELYHVLSWGTDFALTETGYYRITKNLSLLHHTLLMKICVIWNHVSFFFFFQWWILGLHQPQEKEYTVLGGLYIHYVLKTLQNIGKWTLSTHVLPVYALSLSLSECLPSILQHKTIKQKPYCQEMIFFQKIGKFWTILLFKCKFDYSFYFWVNFQCQKNEKKNPWYQVILETFII